MQTHKLSDRQADLLERPFTVEFARPPQQLAHSRETDSERASRRRVVLQWFCCSWRDPERGPAVKEGGPCTRPFASYIPGRTTVAARSTGRIAGTRLLPPSPARRQLA